LVAAYIAHLCEEWWGGTGLPRWFHSTLGADVSPDRFLAINTVALPLFVAGMTGAISSSRLAWIAVALSALLLLNGVIHLLATAAFATYAPGTVTGTLLYLPLGGLVLSSMSRSLPGPVFRRAVIGGIAAHALVTLIAFA
jgi:hypothetical protein